jgi:AAA ATPase-like protein
MAFVGRVRALSRLLAAVEEASSGRARLVLVGGEAGIGKTTLIVEATARSGLLVGWGTCADAERTPAFWPWTAALRGLLNALGPTDAHALTRIDTAELARLLPELAATGSEAADAGLLDGPPDTDVARLRLFDALARFLERLARHAPMLVVLDDLQWVDESSLQLLRFVTQPYRPVPLVIVGAYRHDELGSGTARTLAELAAHGEPVQLHGLLQEEVFELIVDAVGALAADRWAVEVHRRTDGHPFLARQLTEVLADPAQPAGAVPAAAHDLVVRQVERLSGGCRALVEAAAVAGNELLPDVLSEVCGVDAATVALLVEEGGRASWSAMPTPPGPGWRTTCSARPSASDSRSRSGWRCTSTSPTRSSTGTPAAPRCCRPTWPGTARRRSRWTAPNAPSAGPGRRPAPSAPGWPSLKPPHTSPEFAGPSRTPATLRLAGCSSICSSRRPTPAPGPVTRPVRGHCSTTPQAGL